jgi:hypothetical protein
MERGYAMRIVINRLKDLTIIMIKVVKYSNNTHKALDLLDEVIYLLEGELQ